MRNKVIIRCFLLFTLLFSANSINAQNLDESLECKKLRDSAIEKGKIVPENFTEICESLKSFKEVESLVEEEKKELEEVASKKEKKTIIEDVLDSKSNAQKVPLLTFFDLGSNENSVLDRSVRSNDSAIELNASTSNNNALLRLGLLDNSSSIQPKNNSDSSTAQFTTLSLTASSPIDSDESVTDIATLDGLIDSTRLTLRFNQFFLSGIVDPGDPENSELLEEARKICRIVGIEDGCNVTQVEEGLADSSLELSSEEQKEISDTFFNLGFKPNSWNFGYSLEGSVGFENFEFTNAETQEQEDESRVPWSVGASFNFNPPTDIPLLVTFGVEYQEAFSPSGTQTVCPPSDGINPVTCTTGVFGEPISSERLLLSLDGRFKILDKGISLRVTHDLENSATGIDLPIFLIPDREGNLNGGVRLGWTNVEDDNDFSVGLFVGSSFSLF